MHRCDFRLLVRVLAAAALPLMGAATLAGCSGASQHQVIDRNVACSSCHSDEKPVYEGATVPSETVESGALCLDEGDKARAKLVRVDSASDATAVVEL